MKFVSVRELRNQPGRVWEEVKGTETVLTANGKPVAILMGVEEDDLEETLSLLRRARAQAAVSRLREQAFKAGTARLTHAEIDAQIAVARRARPAQ